MKSRRPRGRAGKSRETTAIPREIQRRADVPTVGRIVHYLLFDTRKTVPAIVVAVRDDEHVDLFVMSPYPTIGGSIPKTGEFERNVKFSRCQKRGCWSWPPRAN